MAFMSLAGWAQTNISGYEITLSAGNATYDGTDKKPEVTLTKISGEGPATITTGFNVTWTDGETVVTELIEARPVTGYTVTVEADGTNTFSELPVKTKKFYITKANVTQSVEGALAPNTTYTDLAGASLTLVTTPPTVNFGQTTIEYSVDDAPTVWSTEIPVRSKVGVYTVSYRVPGTDNYNAKAATEIGTVKITGNDLVEGTDYKKPNELMGHLTFNNDDQELLLNAGDALTDKCTMKYKLGDDGEWQTTVPKAKNVGTYTVYWKAEAIDGYYDVTENYTATIDAANPTVNAITAATGTLTYTGIPQNLLLAEGTASLGATPVYTVQYKATEAADYPVAGDPVAYAAVQGTNAGFYQITPKVVAGGNYNAAIGTPIQVEIKKAELTVKTDNKTMGYGEAVPTFTASYTGFKNGETAETAGVTGPAMTCYEDDEAEILVGVSTTTGAGTYKIKATEGSATAANYTFVYNEANYGTLTIDPKELNVDDFTFELAGTSYQYTGSAITTTIPTAKYGTTVDLVSPRDYTYLITNNTNVGTANVIISGQGNFKGSVVKTFAITPKQVYVQPKDNSKAYGATDPSPISTYDIYGTAGDETSKIEGATLNGTVELARVAGENAGSYKIYVKKFTATEGSTANYTIAADQVQNPTSYTGDAAKNLIALFTVQPAEGAGLVLKFKDDVDAAKKTKVYGDANPTWTIDDLEYVSGAVGTDTWATIKPTLSAPTFKLASEKVVNEAQNQVLLESGLLSANYPNVTVQPMDFTVTARPITVTVDDQAITYGAALAEAEQGVNWSITTGELVTWAGVTDVLGLTLNTVNDLSTYGVASEAYPEAITAAITNTNYALTVVKGDLTVTSGAAITIKREGDMDALISAYDGQNINVTLDRNITRTEAWFAMVLPFETSVTELSQQYGYAVVNILNEANDDASKVKFKLHMQTIPANTPFLIKIATAKETTMNFGPKAIVYAADPESHDAAGNEFHGVFKSTELVASDYLWTMVPAQNKFVKLNNAGTTLTPINAYLKTKNNLDAFAPVITVEDFDFASGTTSIKTLNAETMNAFSADGWYNLNGTKLQSVPTQKGVYIQNGKKVIIK